MRAIEALVQLLGRGMMALVWAIVALIQDTLGTSDPEHGRIIVRALQAGTVHDEHLQQGVWREWNLPASEARHLPADALKFYDRDAVLRRCRLVGLAAGGVVLLAIVGLGVVFEIVVSENAALMLYGSGAAAVLFGLFIGNHVGRLQTARLLPEYWIYDTKDGVTPIMPQDEAEDQRWREYTKDYWKAKGIKVPAGEDGEFPNGSPRSSLWFNCDFMHQLYEAKDVKASLMGRGKNAKGLAQATMMGAAALAVGVLVLTSIVARDETEKRDPGPTETPPAFFPTTGVQGGR